MEISLPTRYEKLNPKSISEAKLLRLYVDECDSFYYQIEKIMDRPASTDFESLVVRPASTDFESLVVIISAISREVEDPVMLLKLDPRASYNSMVKIIDKIQGVEREINKKRETVWLKNRLIWQDRKGEISHV
jgi:biopolymer transport protein ExbD